jgi:hypothetical protein
MPPDELPPPPVNVKINFGEKASLVVWSPLPEANLDRQRPVPLAWSDI